MTTFMLGSFGIRCGGLEGDGTAQLASYVALHTTRVGELCAERIIAAILGFFCGVRGVVGRVGFERGI